MNTHQYNRRHTETSLPRTTLNAPAAVQRQKSLALQQRRNCRDRPTVDGRDRPESLVRWQPARSRANTTERFAERRGPACGRSGRSPQ